MKSFKKILAITLLVFGSSVLFAQQDAHANLYKYNMNVINPAYAGADGSLLTTNIRSQWVNVAGSPETQTISLGLPMNDKVGIGLSIVNDKVFVLKETDVYVDFSYKLPMSEGNDLFLGLKAGGSFFNVDLNSVGAPVTDPLFTQNISQFNPNVGVGLYYKAEKYFFNLSVPALLSSKRYEKSGVLVSKATDKMHVYAGAGYEFGLNENINFIPSLMARMVAGSPVSLDLTGTFDIYDKVELGATYRLSESISGIALFKLADWMQFGYSYEHATTDVSNYSSGTHEAILRFNLNSSK